MSPFCAALVAVLSLAVPGAALAADRIRIEIEGVDKAIAANVRSYLTSVRNHDPDEEVDFDLPETTFSTRGPCDRFGAILFIEKEGFMPLFEAVQLAERFDLAIMSTKGVSVTAARQLVDELCGDHEIPLLVLHDFDKPSKSSTSGCGSAISTGS